MSTRTELTAKIETLIHDNNSKEVTASNVREVLKDFRDSNFNIDDDELKLMKYNSTQTLEEYLNSIIGAVPLWGSTDFFDPSSSNGNIESYSDNGIISSMVYQTPSNERSELTINFSQSIADRKLSISFVTDRTNVTSESNYTSTIIYRVSSTQIKIGLREIGGYAGKIRLEILAHKIS
jgi:hypothetical protein